MIYHTLAGPSHLAIVIREFKIYDAASQRHAFKTKNFFMQDKKIICVVPGVSSTVLSLPDVFALSNVKAYY
jgi:hypothetical protein